jgi:hypothetical protein
MVQYALPGAGAPQGGSLPEPPPIHQAARAAGYVPGARSVTTEAGPEYNLEDAADRAAANREVVKANLAGYAATATAAENDAREQQIRQIGLADQQRQLQRDMQAKQQRYDTERAKAASLVESAEQRKIDPDRLWHQRGAAGNIALVLGQAMGAFGASINHTSNWAGELVNAQIERDIGAQEDEIKSGRISANNKLARITEQMGGDIEQAKSVLKEVHLASLDAQIKEHAAWAKAPEAQRAAQLWLAQNQQARLAEEQKQQQLSMGKTTTKVDAKYQPAQAGGTRERTQEERVKYYKNEADIRKYKGLAEGTALDETDQKAVERYGKLRGGAENLTGQVSDVVSLAGGKVEKDGRVVLPGDVPGVGVVKSRLPDAFVSDQASRIRQMLGNLAADVVKDKSGAAVTDSERALLMNILQGGVKTAEELQTGLTIVNKYAARKAKNVESSFPADVRQTYRRNNQGSNAEQYAEEDDSDVGER